MKDIKSFIAEAGVAYINESKRGVTHFTLSQDERDQLCEIIGYASGALGEDEDVNKFEDFRKSLSKQELEDLSNLFDTLDDEQNYPKFTNKIMTDEDINICRKLFAYVSEEDDWDLSCIADTMGLPY